MALDAGLDFLKFFPAEQSGGIDFLKALASPFNGLRFFPTSGISAKNAAEYPPQPHVASVGGCCVAPDALIKAGAWAEIEALAGAANALRKTA